MNNEKNDTKLHESAATEDLTDQEEDDLTDQEYSEEEKKALLKYGIDIEADRRLDNEFLARRRRLRDRYHGALLGLAAGDALGTTLEFKAPDTFKPLSDMVGGGPFNLQPGQWTDDTSMALCLGESLVQCHGFDPKDQMERYCRWWRDGHLSCTGRCFDIGITVSAALSKYRETGDPFSGSVNPRTALATARSCASRPFPWRTAKTWSGPFTTRAKAREPRTARPPRSMRANSIRR
jgi:hypothetical protein